MVLPNSSEEVTSPLQGAIGYCLYSQPSLCPDSRRKFEQVALLDLRERVFHDLVR